jgi:hypothetical protein
MKHTFWEDLLQNFRHLFLITFSIICFIPQFSFGQSGYYITDSTSHFGVNIIDNGDILNSKYCQVKVKEGIRKYSPIEATEYGLKNGRTYVSRDIKLADTLTKVFMERLYKGEMTLYYYRSQGFKTYFIAKDSVLFVELPKYSNDGTVFKSQLSKIRGSCLDIEDQSRYAKYSKNSLKKYFQRIETCDPSPFPHFRYGIIIGYEFSRLNPPSSNQVNSIEQLEFNYDGGLTFGLFIDQPITVSFFSLHLEIIYSRHGYSLNTSTTTKDIDLVANISSLKAPALIRYTFQLASVKPYVNVGTTLCSNFRNDAYLFETNLNGNIIEINEPSDLALIDDKLVGFSLGGGLDWPLNNKNSLFFDLRFNRLYGLSGAGTFSNTDFSLTAGFNF